MDERTALIDPPDAEGEWFAVRIYDRRRRLVRWIHRQAESSSQMLVKVARWRAEDEFRSSAEIVVLRAGTAGDAEARVRAMLE